MNSYSQRFNANWQLRKLQPWKDEPCNVPKKLDYRTIFSLDKHRSLLRNKSFKKTSSIKVFKRNEAKEHEYRILPKTLIDQPQYTRLIPSPQLLPKAPKIRHQGSVDRLPELKMQRRIQLQRKLFLIVNRQHAYRQNNCKLSRMRRKTMAQKKL